MIVAAFLKVCVLLISPLLSPSLLDPSVYQSVSILLALVLCQIFPTGSLISHSLTAVCIRRRHVVPVLCVFSSVVIAAYQSCDIKGIF